MTVLGYTLGKRIGPNGSEFIGPDRQRLQAALTSAHLAAQRLATRWSQRRGRQASPSLFDEVTS